MGPIHKIFLMFNKFVQKKANARETISVKDIL